MKDVFLQMSSYPFLPFVVNQQGAHRAEEKTSKENKGTPLLAF